MAGLVGTRVNEGHEAFLLHVPVHIQQTYYNSCYISYTNGRFRDYTDLWGGNNPQGLGYGVTRDSCHKSLVSCPDAHGQEEGGSRLLGRGVEAQLAPCLSRGA